MIKHIVLFKLDNKEKQIKEEILKRLLNMNGKIEGLLNIEAGIDFLNSERSYDIALICNFLDITSFEKYKTHPVHVPVIDFMRPYVEKSKAVDFEV